MELRKEESSDELLDTRLDDRLLCLEEVDSEELSMLELRAELAEELIALELELLTLVL
jgi:hypothetical protein